MLTEIWLRLWALGAAARWTGAAALSTVLGLGLVGLALYHQLGRRH
jgi:hypothetical protein